MKFAQTCSFVFTVLLLFVSVSAVHGATYTVLQNIIDDSNPGSLRWAINMANANPGPDTIAFNITTGPGPLYTIYPDSQLPLLFDPSGVLIDGFTQPGSSAGANPPSTAVLTVEVNGARAGLSHGFWIVSPMNTIQGLVVDSFEQDGIRIQATPDPGTFINIVYCCFIGTDPTGLMDWGNGWNQMSFWAGVNIICTPEPPGFAFDNIVDRCLISGNWSEGVSISNCPPGDVYMNAVLDCYIGVDIVGMADLGNDHDGVYIGEAAHDNIIDGNVISGNDYSGVGIVGYQPQGLYTNNNIVFNNLIGLASDGVTPMLNLRNGVSIGQYGPGGNYGYACGNIVDSNTIAHNGRNGVMIWEDQSNTINADNNMIRRNSIYSNALLGIDLGDNGVTPNDGGDPDTGPNEEINFPVITSALYVSPQTTISGTVDIDTDPTQAFVEVFQAMSDPSGYGEGMGFLGSTNPDAAGNWSLSVTGLIAGDMVTATTTDMLRNTSEFGLNVAVVSSVEEERVRAPLRYALTQNSPNPFSDVTKIRFSIMQTTYIDLIVYDVSGRCVKVLATGLYSAGTYTVYWDGFDENNQPVPSGVYFYGLATDEFTSTRTLIKAR